jgi:hypothetical protein
VNWNKAVVKPLLAAKIQMLHINTSVGSMKWVTNAPIKFNVL